MHWGAFLFIHLFIHLYWTLCSSRRGASSCECTHTSCWVTGTGHLHGLGSPPSECWGGRGGGHMGWVRSQPASLIWANQEQRQSVCRMASDAFTCCRKYNNYNTSNSWTTTHKMWLGWKWITNSHTHKKRNLSARHQQCVQCVLCKLCVLELLFKQIFSNAHQLTLCAMFVSLFPTCHLKLWLEYVKICVN